MLKDGLFHVYMCMTELSADTSHSSYKTRTVHKIIQSNLAQRQGYFRAECNYVQGILRLKTFEELYPIFRIVPNAVVFMAGIPLSTTSCTLLSFLDNRRVCSQLCCQHCTWEHWNCGNDSYTIHCMNVSLGYIICYWYKKKNRWTRVCTSCGSLSWHDQSWEYLHTQNGYDHGATPQQTVPWQVLGWSPDPEKWTTWSE